MQIFLFGLILFFTSAMAAEQPSKFDIQAYETKVKSLASPHSVVQYTDASGNRIEETDESTAYVRKTFTKDGLYVEVQSFYKNGSMKVDGQYALFFGNADVTVGTWKHYDERGRLIRTVDYENGYKIHFENVVKICNDRKINATQNPPSLSRTHAKHAQPMWTVEWTVGKSSASGKSYGVVRVTDGITIDGVTGKVTEFKNKNAQ